MFSFFVLYSFIFLLAQFNKCTQGMHVYERESYLPYMHVLFFFFFFFFFLSSSSFYKKRKKREKREENS